MTQSQWLGILGMFFAIVGPGLTSIGVPWAFASALATFGSWLAFRASGGQSQVAQVGTPKPPPDQHGVARVDLIVWLALVGFGVVAIAFSACASQDITVRESVQPKFDPGPPCLITAHVDGVRVMRIRWDQACPVDMPTSWLCARLSEKAPGARLPAVCGDGR